MTLCILNYNNYYNRLIKIEESLADYEDYIIYEVANTNFNPADKVIAKHIVGQGEYDGSGDYALLIDPLGNISARWFIIKSDRTRAGQWELTLKRDVVADYYNVLIQSPMFIEKATLGIDNPLIFNNENFSVNQIKTSETLIKDKTGCAWLVGYYAKNITDLSGAVPINKNIVAEPIDSANIESWEYYKYSTNSKMVGPVSYGEYSFKAAVGPAMSPSYVEYKVNQFSAQTERNNITTQTVQLQKIGSIPTENEVRVAVLNYGVDNLDPAPYSGVSTKIAVDDLLSYNGKLIKTLDGKYYSIAVSTSQRSNYTISIGSGGLFNGLSTICSNIGFSGTPNTNTFKYTYSATLYSLNITERKDLETTYDITAASNRLLTEDSAYNIIAIPYGAVNVNLGNSTITTTKDIGLATAASLQASQKLLDIQLLPYFPMQELILAEGEISAADPRTYSLIVDKTDSTNVGVIFNIPRANFSFNITDISIAPAQTNIGKKLNNECDKYRLASPNYSNYFDFSLEKNNGVQYFNIDCSYKPFTPYIHINPDFKGLYGYDDNSPRGLVLGGDFSLTQITDAWQQYQLQNKNFQETFDRQLQNMEVNNKYQRIQEKVTAGVGTVAGAIAGAGTGLISSGGNPAGGIAGAAFGAISSGIGGLADIVINEQLRTEAMDYTRDLFNYNLGNIQALPQTISKVSAFNENNKIFPVLEYYTCTETERLAFLNKIAWNGMTTMTIGKISDYLGNSWELSGVEDKGYIKGQLIRLVDTSADFRLVNAISEELYKGVYTK